MPFVATQMELDIIILSEVNKKKKDKYHIYIWNLKYGPNEPTHKTETDPQTQKADLWCSRAVGQERDGRQIWGQQMQSIILIYRMDKQGPTVQHRKLMYSISVINHNAVSYKEDCVYICG